MRCDGTLERGVNDVSGGDIAVTRELDGDTLIWTLVPFKRVTRMRRQAN